MSTTRSQLYRDCPRPRQCRGRRARVTSEAGFQGPQVVQHSARLGGSSIAKATARSTTSCAPSVSEHDVAEIASHGG